MKNKDLLEKEKKEILQRINKAVKDGDEAGFAQAFTEFSENIQAAVMSEAREFMQAADANILTARAVRQLTSAENDYYQKVITAMKSSNPQQALTELDVVMPKTTIDAVFEDVAEKHPLLDAINFQNTSGLIEYLVNTQGSELATWSGSMGLFPRC